jgi:hypothetical protein
MVDGSVDNTGKDPLRNFGVVISDEKISPRVLPTVQCVRTYVTGINRLIRWRARRQISPCHQGTCNVLAPLTDTKIEAGIAADLQARGLDPSKRT